MTRFSLLRLTSAGLYCELGGFHIDPWSPVAKAIITHAHADHFAAGCKQYLTAAPGRRILQHRLGPHATIQSISYGEIVDCFGVRVSFHPAGHILGSSQIRVEHRGEIWVISGDYKVASDPTCAPFEPIRCHTLITESTFGHPFFSWQPQAEVFDEIHTWWRENQQQGVASLLYAYSLGKAQRLLAGLNHEQGPIFVHPQVELNNEFYREVGIVFPHVTPFASDISAECWTRSLVILPPNQRWQPNLAAIGRYRSAFVSGWMALPNGPKQRRVERGFALSDHADHAEILDTIVATGAETIFATHGYIDELVKILHEKGLDAQPLRTPRCKNPPEIPAIQREFKF